MGEPYITMYYISSNQNKEIFVNGLVILENIKNMRLIYPKNLSEESEDKSSIFVNLSNNRVNKVTNHQANKIYDEIESLDKNIDLVLNRYKNAKLLKIDGGFEKDILQNIGK